jgi:hypothetical protein
MASRMRRFPNKRKLLFCASHQEDPEVREKCETVLHGKGYAVEVDVAEQNPLASPDVAPINTNTGGR